MWLTGPVAPWHVGSSQTRARTRVPCIGRQILNHCATREALYILLIRYSTEKLRLLKLVGKGWILLKHPTTRTGVLAKSSLPDVSSVSSGTNGPGGWSPHSLLPWACASVGVGVRAGHTRTHSPRAAQSRAPSHLKACQLSRPSFNAQPLSPPSLLRIPPPK